MVQVPAALNLVDVGTTCLAKLRLRMLMCEMGVVDLQTFAAYGAEKRDPVREQRYASKSYARLIKLIVQLASQVQALGQLARTQQRCARQFRLLPWFTWELCFLVLVFLAMFELTGLKVFC